MGRKLFGFYQGNNYNIYLDGAFASKVMEINKGRLSVDFVGPSMHQSIATSILQSTSGDKTAQWLVKNHKDTTLPFYASSAVTVLFGMFEINQRERAQAQAH